MKKERRYDRIKARFEVFDDFVDGYIENTVFEKESAVVFECERRVDMLIDYFIKFMKMYGISKDLIIEAMQNYINEEGELGEL